jgi:uncharacterized membrane-anchored protein YhcB (DUF1043 family)
MAWHQFLWNIEWCHDTLELLQILMLGVLLGVVVAIAILTKLSDRQWRQRLQDTQNELRRTQSCVNEMRRQIEKYHPHEE